MNDTSLSIRLDRFTELLLQEKAAAMGRSESDLVNELLVTHFSSHPRFATAEDVAYWNEIIGCADDLTVYSSTK
ncbi:hypothetical protein BH10PLA2_BH10PLA2_31750 [soil metagenome]